MDKLYVDLISDDSDRLSEFADIIPWNLYDLAGDGVVSVLAAYSDDEPAAAAVFEHREKVTILRFIHTKEEYRKQGAAKAIIDFACNAKGEDGNPVRLLADLTYTGFESAEPFLRACGFNDAGTYPCMHFIIEDLRKFAKDVPSDYKWKTLTDIPKQAVLDFISPVLPEMLMPLSRETVFWPTASPVSGVLLKNQKPCAIALFEECEEEVRLNWFYSQVPQDVLRLLGVSCRLFMQDYDGSFEMSFVGYNDNTIEFLRRVTEGAEIDERIILSR